MFVCDELFARKNRSSHLWWVLLYKKEGQGRCKESATRGREEEGKKRRETHFIFELLGLGSPGP